MTRYFHDEIMKHRYCSGAYSTFWKFLLNRFKLLLAEVAQHFFAKLTDKHKLRPRCSRDSTIYMPQKVNVMTQKVVFGNPTNELLLRAQKLVGLDETIPGVVRTAKTVKQLLPTGRLLLRNTVFVAFLRWGGACVLWRLLLPGQIFGLPIGNIRVHRPKDLHWYWQQRNQMFGTSRLDITWGRSLWESPPPCWYIGVFWDTEHRDG